jgi:hypothetical protein
MRFGARRALLRSPAIISGAPYAADAVDPQGAPNGYYSRASGLTSATDTKVGTVSFWFWMKAANANSQSIFAITQDTAVRGMFIERTSGNKLRVFCRSAGATTLLDISTTTNYTTSMSAYAHCHMYWDLATSTADILIDGVTQAAAPTTLITTTNIDYTTNGARALTGASPGTSNYNGWIADLYVNTDACITDNTKFRTAGGALVDLGATGQLPSGAQTVCCFTGGSSGWGTNKGYGGAFTLTNTVNDAASDPP